MASVNGFFQLTTESAKSAARLYFDPVVRVRHSVRKLSIEARPLLEGLTRRTVPDGVNPKGCIDAVTPLRTELGSKDERQVTPSGRSAEPDGPPPTPPDPARDR